MMGKIEEALKKISENYNIKGCSLCCDMAESALSALSSSVVVVDRELLRDILTPDVLVALDYVHNDYTPMTPEDIIAYLQQKESK